MSRACPSGARPGGTSLPAGAPTGLPVFSCVGLPEECHAPCLVPPPDLVLDGRCCPVGRRAGAKPVADRGAHRPGAGHAAGACAAGRADRPAARGRRRPAGVGGPADHARAGLAHLLEERRRLRHAHRAAVDAAARRDGGRHRLAPAAQVPHRPARQLRLRRHGAAAGAADRHARIPALAAGRQHGDPAPGHLAGVPAGMHSAGRRVHPAVAAAQLHRAARRGVRRGAAKPAGRTGGRAPGRADRGRPAPGGARGRPARERARAGAGAVSRDAQHRRHRRHARRAGPAGRPPHLAPAMGRRGVDGRHPRLARPRRRARAPAAGAGGG